MRWVKEWTNGIGEVRYQPHIGEDFGLYDDGDVAVWIKRPGDVPEKPGGYPETPVLYRSQRRATRIARRKFVQTAKDDWRPKKQ